MKKTVVIGASLNPERTSHNAVLQLKRNGHHVIAIGLREGLIEGVPVLKGRPDVRGVDTVTLYINPSRQEEMMDYILSLHPNRIIFNPGTENTKFFERAAKNGIEAIEACTLTLLAIGAY